MEEETTVAAQAVTQVASTMAEQTKTLLHYDELKQYLTWGNLVKVIVSVLTIFLFYVLYRVIKKLFNKQNKEKIKAHTLMMINKAFSYLFWILIIMYVLNLFGINLSAIWGAAGIAGVAIGFAAQTSVSNIISGVFVLSEKAMKIGDFISIAGESGNVDSIGLLSVKIKTLDNQLIRIPNSTIINSNLKNFNAFNTRRLVFQIPISYECDLQKELSAIQKVPAMCKTVLKDPAPAVFYDGFGDAGVNLMLAVWIKSSDLIQTKNDIYMNIMTVCNEEKVTIPYMRYDVKILNGENSTSKKITTPVAKKTSVRKVVKK